MLYKMAISDLPVDVEHYSGWRCSIFQKYA